MQRARCKVREVTFWDRVVLGLVIGFGIAWFVAPIVVMWLMVLVVIKLGSVALD